MIENVSYEKMLAKLNVNHTDVDVFFFLLVFFPDLYSVLLFELVCYILEKPIKT